MFKGKQSKEKEQPVVINPEVPELPEMTPEPVAELQQQPQSIVQPVQQPVAQPQSMQQTQQVQQTERQAIIIETAIIAQGIYKYVVETNYPLSVGFCQVVQ